MQLSSVSTGDAGEAARELANRVESAVGAAVRGKPQAVRLALVALLSGGHVLVEDVPGTGKTLLAKSLAAAIGGHFGRVQCTPDLLPADITGTSIYGPATGSWEFRPGPIFANVVLVDEINRASSRTQAALLEPMEERQVSVDGTTHALPDPFFCIATQNPFGTAGTFPLPESQLDRFSIVITMGLPDRDSEREILRGEGGVPALTHHAVTSPSEVRAAIEAVRDVYIAPQLLEYVLDFAAATRAHPEIALGASPRASLGLLHAAQAHATAAGRAFVAPEDIHAVAVAALAHRIVPAAASGITGAARLVAAIIGGLPLPRP